MKKTTKRAKAKAERKTTRRALCKCLSILLAVLLLTAAFPLSPARGETVLAFTVTVGAPQVTQETSVSRYTYDDTTDPGEAQLSETTGDLEMPAGYEGQITVAVDVTAGQVTGVTVANNTISGSGNSWSGAIPYSSGNSYRGAVALGGQDVWFTIPALAAASGPGGPDNEYVAGVTVNGERLQGRLDGGVYFYDATTDREDGIVEVAVVLAAGADCKGFRWGGTVSDFGNVEQENTWVFVLANGDQGDLYLDFWDEQLQGDYPKVAVNITNINQGTDPQEPDPLIDGVTVNGTPAHGGYTQDGYIYTATVRQPDGNQIQIRPAEGTYCPEWDEPEQSGGDWAMVDEDWTSWTLGSMTAGNPAVLSLWLAHDIGETEARFTLEITYVPEPVKPDPPTGGGGGGGATPPEAKAPNINVINETNQPNVSSDTVLTPANTVEAGGQSSTTVTSAEVQAMVDLAEAHSGDVADGENEAIIRIEDQTPGGNDSYQVNLSAGDVAAIAGSAIDLLSVSTGVSEFRIRREALQGLPTGSSGEVQIKLARLNHRGKPGVDAVLAAGERIITMVDGVYTLEIRIPYKPQPGEDPNSLCIEYLREDGETELVTESKYDPERQTVSFFPSHLSKYGVAYRPVLYSDVPPGHWANGYVTFLAARDIITNAPGTKYRPDDAVSRAEFINMAARAFSAANLGRRSLQSYRDVPTGAWYARAVGWSYMNNISPVLASGGNFYPERGLNREETSTLANNISLSVSLRLRADKPARFSDSGAISPFAQNAVARMAACDIVLEAGGGRFLPQGKSTRADAARSISLMLAKMR